MSQSTSPHTVSLSRNPNLSAPSVDRSSPNQIKESFGDNWWTGLPPSRCRGFNPSTNTLHALPLVNLSLCSRQDVLDYFDNTWTLTEVLFSAIKSESTLLRPPYHQLRHPLMFYYGHTAVLFTNKLRLAGLFKEPIDLYLEKILETGVDEMSWDDMSKNEMQWPRLEVIHAYKKIVYQRIKELILTHPSLENASTISHSHPMWALFMGFEHEKIHFETSSVLIRELPIELVETPNYWPSLHPSAKGTPSLKPMIVPDVNWHQVTNKQTVTIGKPDSTPSYGWDNEYGQRQVQTLPFQVTQNLITNGQFFDFVASLAYTDDKYWSEEGKLWRKFRNTKRPTFWVGFGPEGSHEYKLRTIFEIIDMPWDWPAEVNFHEASAFARWKQDLDKSQLHYRLITEAEHHALRTGNEDPVLQKSTFTADAFRSLPYNFNFAFSSPSAVGAFNNQEAVNDLFGNVWQWAEDQFNPLEGFKVNPLYDDFSTPCFDGKHQMILGGSFISCGHEASVYARFHFRPHFFQHAGFRIAATLDGSADNGAKKLNVSTNYIHPQRRDVLAQMKNEDWWKNAQQPLEISNEEFSENWALSVKKMYDWNESFKAMNPAGKALDVIANKPKAGFHVPHQASKTFPAHPSDLKNLMDFIFTEMAPLGQAPGHPGYLAYVAGAGNAISDIAQAIGQRINQFTGHYSLSPGLVAIEQEALNWIKSMAGFPESSGALFTSGGSQANLHALAIARKQKLVNYDLSKARFYCSTQVHHCIGKALAILGFPKESLQLIATTSKQAMDLQILKNQITQDKNAGLQPIAVIGTAGSTNTGAIDDLNGIAKICREENLWFHIDAAYGGFFLLTEKGKARLSGFEKADSAALDPHKSFSLPYGTGCLLLKNPQNFYFDFKGASSYMPPSTTSLSDPFEVDYADISMELSRDARGLRFWLPVKYYGVGPFKLNLEEKIKLAEWLFESLQTLPSIEFANSPDLSIVTFRLKNNRTKELLDFINNQGSFFLTACSINNEIYIRICLLGFRTHFDQTQKLFQIIKGWVKE